MSSKLITLQLRPRGAIIHNLPEEFRISSDAPISDLYEGLSHAAKLSVHRLRITKGSDGSTLDNSKTLVTQWTGLRDQSTVYVKDLGPQIAWRTVFIVEYLGPLLIHPLVYLLRPYLYHSAPTEASYLQMLCCILICVHFLKREVETLYVHRFSASTMPARNIVKNSLHYWVLAGLNIAGWIYAPFSPTAKEPNKLLLCFGLVSYVVGELGNLKTHLVLRGLRSPGRKERGIPQGFGFNLVTCPNYMFETVSWIGIYLVSGLSYSVLLFSVVATCQMILWAQKKEMVYRREFRDKYKKKSYSMLPGLV